jgi:hypothetical protein
MLVRCLLGFVAFVVAVCATVTDLRAWDDAKYPDLKGAWHRPGAAQWDPTKPRGLGQGAPLTPEYQAIFKTDLADTVHGGQSYNPQARCFPGGMPRVMIAYDPIQFIVTPGLTVMRTDHLTETRHIFTDGRSFPTRIKPSFEGYSIGRWLDQDGDGRFEVLEVETRGMKGPRILDADGVPLAADNETIVKELFFLDKSNPDLLHDQITTIDHAFTRPWTVTRSYRRERNPVWTEEPCSEGNRYLVLGNQTYFMGADRVLMPTRKDQPPPDLKFFEEPNK